MSNDLSKDVLGAIKKKTGKNITANSVSKIASTVQPDSLENEAELRKLVRSIADMAKIKMTDSQFEHIVKTIKSSGMKTSNIEALMKILIR
ncbi:MAG: stage VI sporulation protein F [Candidatus Pristimantibacillus lignocellulolyticus]|uniref:Stage VI sporulation protein F n=1 Tax=Candidatus Pristimantibacillus lignocellulolyticus TaxID=2994561 RepID=A0A9J6ZDB3_9BACL|nr:MAG: stage VI sporulation protein F [Candidatus Pristimantibacillus lignocellulolyticus]